MNLVMKLVRRTWIERLFSFSPWEPKKQFKEIPDYEASRAEERRISAEMRSASVTGLTTKKITRPTRGITVNNKRLPETPIAPAPAPSSGMDPLTAGMLGYMIGSSGHHSSPSPAPFESGRGGQFDGGGASGRWDAPASTFYDPPAASPAYEAPAPSPSYDSGSASVSDSTSSYDV